MQILSKQIERSNVVAVYAGDTFVLPEPATLLSMFTGDSGKGARFLDDPVMNIRVFEFPALKIKFIFEPQRFRIEEEGFRTPSDARCAEYLYRAAVSLYPALTPASYGFNYDAIYKMTSVIPQQEILKPFMKQYTSELVKDFGWQFTLAREKGKKLETYFIKAVSPLEFSVHANFHFQNVSFPEEKQFQELYEKCYTAMDAIFSEFSF